MIVGSKITGFVRKIFRIPKPPQKQPEREPLLANTKIAGDEESPPDSQSSTPESAPKIMDILSVQTTLNLAVYTILALFSQIGRAHV